GGGAGRGGRAGGAGRGFGRGWGPRGESLAVRGLQDDRMTAPPASARGLRMNRWWGLVAGIVLAASDTAVVHVAGTTIEVNGRDATLLVGAFFGTSFALLGFLIGYVIEGRRRDREAAALIRTQVEAIAAA